ncbi:hypothetical protein M662_09205 [Bacillus sp. SB49]|uniref:MotE family protein n=1 Tax=Bacillaceae TaxID=186817 RepID=UPI0002A4E773|nr:MULTISPECIES: hypothetical protein [Bacillaceae]ELK44743.1 hypothetical protein D479_17699 [Halobacillus sp. BAB-2008]QHT46658.1 hypothetical protein M662_09205 [Bacillus sp. SB49]
MAKKLPKQQTGGSRFLKIFSAVVFPLLFLVVLTVIVMTLMGYNVFEQVEKYGANIPGIADTTSTDSASSEETDKLQAMLANKEAEIEQLKEQASAGDAEKKDMENQIVQLEKELEGTTEERGEEDVEEDSAKDIAASFQKMDPEEAAPIISTMNQDLAVQVLRLIAVEERGDILGQMDPEIAASYASALIDS